MVCYCFIVSLSFVFPFCGCSCFSVCTFLLYVDVVSLFVFSFCVFRLLLLCMVLVCWSFVCSCVHTCCMFLLWRSCVFRSCRYIVSLFCGLSPFVVSFCMVLCTFPLHNVRSCLSFGSPFAMLLMLVVLVLCTFMLCLYLFVSCCSFVAFPFVCVYNVLLL